MFVLFSENPFSFRLPLKGAMEALANAFVDHLIDSRYVGPSVPNSVGLTKRNLMNIYNLVSYREQCHVSSS